jgi:hypothetical protein
MQTTTAQTVRLSSASLSFSHYSGDISARERETGDAITITGATPQELRAAVDGFISGLRYTDASPEVAGWLDDLADSVARSLAHHRPAAPADTEA